MSSYVMFIADRCISVIETPLPWQYTVGVSNLNSVKGVGKVINGKVFMNLYENMGFEESEVLKDHIAYMGKKEDAGNAIKCLVVETLLAMASDEDHQQLVEELDYCLEYVTEVDVTARDHEITKVGQLAPTWLSLTSYGVLTPEDMYNLVMAYKKA